MSEWVGERPAQVVATTAIPAYATLHPKDFRIDNAPEQDKTRTAERLIGRYAITPIHKGQAITETALSSKAFDLSRREIVRIQIKSMPPLDDHTLPQVVDILFSAREAPHTGTQISAALLAVDSGTSPPSVTLALTADQIGEAVKWIASSDAYIALRP
jgi:hypothetical protein